MTEEIDLRLSAAAALVLALLLLHGVGHPPAAWMPFATWALRVALACGLCTVVVGSVVALAARSRATGLWVERIRYALGHDAVPIVQSPPAPTPVGMFEDEEDGHGGR